MRGQLKIAIIIPCFNESLTIDKVVSDCRQASPQSDIYVFDNNSSDNTKLAAERAGAKVIHSPLQGKGHVIRHAFKIVHADYYVMLDGDDTYPAEMIPKLLEEAQAKNLDMLIATRMTNHTKKAFSRTHYFGNQFFSKFVSIIFNYNVNDIFSGYRIFNQEFAKNVLITSHGFEIEADLTLEAISQGWTIGEYPITYRDRPQGSQSKLNTYKDGFRILKFIFNVLRDFKPLTFFTFLSFSSFVLSILMGIAPIRDYLNYAYVYTVPRAILAASLMILSAVFLCVGLILDSQKRYYQKQMLAIKNTKNSGHNSPYDTKKSA